VFNHSTPEMIEIESLSATMIGDGTGVVMNCLLPKAGHILLRMHSAVLKRFCEQAVQELGRSPEALSAPALSHGARSQLIQLDA
jgi:hypothetical protein